MFLIERGHRVAVLAVDPSSSRTGGSILGLLFLALMFVHCTVFNLNILKKNQNSTSQATRRE